MAAYRKIPATPTGGLWPVRDPHHTHRNARSRGEADGQLRRAYDRAGSFCETCASRRSQPSSHWLVAVTRTRINTRILLLADIRNGFRLLSSYPVVRSCTERMNQRNVDVLRTSMSFVLDPATLRVPTRTTTG